MSDSKPDETNAMMQLLLKLDKKLDKQNNEIKEIQSSFKINFNELKNEIKIGHDNLVKKVDKVITKLDENLNQLVSQKVNSSTQQNAVLNNNVFKNDNSNNE